jgi:hypothetical protein
VTNVAKNEFESVVSGGDQGFESAASDLETDCLIFWRGKSRPGQAVRRKVE